MKNEKEDGIAAVGGKLHVTEYENFKVSPWVFAFSSFTGEVLVICDTG